MGGDGNGFIPGYIFQMLPKNRAFTRFEAVCYLKCLENTSVSIASLAERMIWSWRKTLKLIKALGGEIQYPKDTRTAQNQKGILVFSTKAPEKKRHQQKSSYRTKKGRLLSGKRFSIFERFWAAFNYKQGKAEAADVFYSLPPMKPKEWERLILAARVEAEILRPRNIAAGRTPKMAQGWLSGRRFEDEIYDGYQILENGHIVKRTDRPAPRGQCPDCENKGVYYINQWNPQLRVFEETTAACGRCKGGKTKDDRISSGGWVNGERLCACGKPVTADHLQYENHTIQCVHCGGDLAEMTLKENGELEAITWRV